MRRSLLTLVLFFSGTTLFAQTHPAFFMRSSDTTRYAAMKANYDANPASPSAFGGQIYKVLKTDADSGARYKDFGQLAAWMYHVSGDSAYVAKAWTQLSTETYHAGGNFLNLPEVCSNSGVSGNYSRAYGWQLVLMYDWLYTGLSAGQRTTFLNKLNVMAACVTATGGPAGWTYRDGDTDQTVGDYFMMALLEVSTGSYNTTGHGYWTDATRKIGGYASTASDIANRRNATRFYIDNFATGGEFVESTEYNLGSVDTLLAAAEAMRSVQTPTDNYPEITAYQKDAAKSFIHSMSPGMTSASLPYQWGDMQAVRSRMDYHRWQNCAVLAGVNIGATVGDEIQDFCLDYVEALTLAAIDPYPIGFLVFDPTATRGDHTTLDKTLWSSGMGILLARTGWTTSDSFFATQFSNNVSTSRPGVSGTTGTAPIDHAGSSFGEFQLWKNGAWAITHPIGYSYITDGDSRGTNGIALGGLPAGSSAPREYRQATALESNATHNFEYITGTQGGATERAPYWAMPSSFFHEHSRSIVWLKSLDVIVVYDRTNATAPDTVGYGAALKTWMDARPRKELYVHSTVSPTLGTGYLEWAYSGSNKTRVNQLLPASVTRTIENEATVWDASFYLVGTIAASEKKFHTIITPTVTAQWDTFLNVWDAYGTGTPVTTTLVQDTSAKVDAALITNVTSNTLLAFNAIQGPNLANRVLVGGSGYYPGTNAPILAAVRIRDSSYTLTWAAGALATKAILFDLDTGTSWQYKINGGTALDLTVSANGVAVVDIANTGTVTLDVLAAGFAPVTITTGSLPSGRKNTAYSQQLACAGGNGGACTWSKTVGNFPTGITINGSGLISGTPTVFESQTFTIQACDSQPSCGTREFTLAIADLPAITTASLPNGSIGAAYNQSLAATGGTAPYTYAVFSGTLPAGLSLSGAGAITGTPTTVGVSPITFRVTDNAAATGDAFLSITIVPALPTLTVSASSGTSSVVLEIGIPGLARQDSCTVNLMEGESIQATATSTSGPARRVVSFSGLTQSKTYGVDVACGTAAAPRAYFTTLDPTKFPVGNVAWKTSLKPSASLLARNVTKAKVTATPVGGGAAITATEACATGCVVTVTLTGTLYDIYQEWLTAADVVVATSKTRTVAVPQGAGP